MPLFRRRASGSESADPYGRTREADEAIGQALGLPLATVRAITGILRGAVTDDVCRLLPGVEQSTAGRPLLLVSAAAQQIPITTVQALRPELAFGNAAAASLPGMMLYPVTLELIRRYDVAHPQSPFAQHQDTAPPLPTPDLRNSYEALQQSVEGNGNELSASRTAGAAITNAVLAAIDDPLSRSWGSWALVAAVTAVNAHQHLLPEPGRARHRPPDQQAGAQAAGFAYHLGKSVLAAAAVVMVGVLSAHACEVPGTGTDSGQSATPVPEPPLFRTLRRADRFRGHAREVAGPVTLAAARHASV